MAVQRGSAHLLGYRRRHGAETGTREVGWWGLRALGGGRVKDAEVCYVC